MKSINILMVCSVISITSFVFANTKVPCRQYITANIIVDYNQFSMNNSTKQNWGVLKSVREISRPRAVQDNCEYWLQIDDQRIGEIESNAFKYLMIDGLEIMRNSYLYINDGSFNGLKMLKFLKIHSTLFTLDNHKVIFKSIKNITSLEFGTYSDYNFKIILDSFSLLKNLTIHTVFTDEFDEYTFLNASSSIEYLEFINFNINKIHEKTFSHLTNLIELKFTNSGIEELITGAFDKLDQLKYLTFDVYYPMTFKKNIFNVFKKLEILKIHKCIYKIEPGTFMGLKAKYVDLNDNGMEIIKSGTFRGIQTTNLHLSSNQIKEIENDAFVDSNIENLFLWNTSINTTTLINKSTWGLLNSTNIIINYKI